jgi:hypothetical protein
MEGDYTAEDGFSSLIDSQNDGEGVSQFRATVVTCNGYWASYKIHLNKGIH